MNRAKCRSCGAPIIWVETANAKLIPLDAEPVEDGNITLGISGLAYVGENAWPLFTEGNRYKSHFETCPQAKSGRKKQ